MSSTDRSNSVEKGISPRMDAISLTNEILVNSNNFSEIPQICNKLIKHLFLNQYLLYTDLNNFFESSDVLTVLIKSLEHLQISSKRDVLRVIHLLLHANRSLRDKARQSVDFKTFLQRNLEQTECWENRMKFKHHINIASQLISDRESTACDFNSSSIRKLACNALNVIVSSNTQDNDDVLPCIVFYACSMFTGTFEDIPTNIEEEPAAEKILTKSVTGRILDILRDYIQDFKIFYTKENELNRTQYILYKAKAEFSFQQLCRTITYYSYRSNPLRMNIYQAGIYEIIKNLLSMVHIPEVLLSCGLDILKLSGKDQAILMGVKNSFLQSINSKLNAQLSREILSDKIKVSLSQLLTVYEVIKTIKSDKASSSTTVDNESIDIPSGDFLRQPQTNDEHSLSRHTTNLKYNPRCPSNSIYFEDWTKSDIRKWLIDNHLEDLKETFSYLSGGGLKQLKILANLPDKIKFVEFFVGTMRMRLDLTLELLNAIDKL